MNISLETLNTETLKPKYNRSIRHLFLLDEMSRIIGFDPLEYNGRQHIEWDWSNYSEVRTIAQQKKHERTCAKNRKRRQNKKR